ncbi:MAG: hypothetical protein WBV82_29340 [Myxococcaceae bacterium]
MGKIILLSILVTTIVLPTWMARDPDPVRGLRKTMVRTSLFAVLYWLGVMFFTPLV